MAFEILKSRNNKYYWRAKSANGKILCVSEMYNAKQNAITGIKALLRQTALGTSWIKDKTGEPRSKYA